MISVLLYQCINQVDMGLQIESKFSISQQTFDNLPETDGIINLFG